MSHSTHENAANKARDIQHKATAQLNHLASTQVPEAMRKVAERNIAQTRELYERSKEALHAVLESWQRTFDAAGQGALALNHKVMDVTQRNINSGFVFAKSLVGAKNLSEAMELQAAYWREQLDALTRQAEEMRTLSADVAADVTKPVKDQVRRGMGETS